MNLFRYCGDDPVDLSDPMGLKVEETLLKKMIENLKKLEKHQRKDHQDRTQATKVDGAPGKEIKGTIRTKWDGQRGGFRRDKLKTEVLPEDYDSIAGTSHYHSSPYYKVKGDDGKWHDTSLPSQDADVAHLKKPMLFGSDPFKNSGKALLLEPVKGREPIQTVIEIRYER